MSTNRMFSKRSAEEFYTDMVRFQNKKDRKVEELQRIKDQQEQAIMNRSASRDRIALHDSNFHERLYEKNIGNLSRRREREHS